MVIVHLSGGFGNQLFSYAFGYSMARKRQEELVIDTAIQDQDWFFRNPDILNLNIQYDRRITYPIRRDLLSRGILNRINFRRAIGWHTDIYKEKDVDGYVDAYYEAAAGSRDIYLKGNWGSVRFFVDEAEAVRKMYVFKQPLSQQAQRIADEMGGCRNSVALHYRRGDYVGLGACMTADYFVNAMDYMEKKLGHPVFYCFSEELDWVEEQFKSLPYQIKYIDYKSPDKGMEDFRLIQSGHHQIISNSSYSWWAAYLNTDPDKIVVAPIIWDPEFCLPEWKGLPCEMIRG